MKKMLWAINHPKVTAYSIGPLMDAWHGSIKDLDAPLDYIDKPSEKI